MFLKIVLAIIAIWVVLAIVGFLVKAIFWVGVIAVIGFAVTAAIGGAKRQRINRRY